MNKLADPLVLPLFLAGVVDQDEAAGLTTWLVGKDCQVAVMLCMRGLPFDGTMHSNSTDQWLIVLEGEATVYLGDPSVGHHLIKGSSLFISAGMPHGVDLQPGYMDITIHNGQRYAQKGGEENAGT